MNPFSDILQSLETSVTAEHVIYANTRNTRQQAQRQILLTTRQFSRDETLANVEHDAGYEDPRHSIIFIARPESVLRSIVQLQQRIVQIFVENGVAETSLWITPSEKLHMTLMDLVSCVPRETVEDLLPCVNVSAIMGQVPQQSKCTLKDPMLMVDGTALALSFLPTGKENEDSHIRLRSQLWDGCHQCGTTPAMRYVSMSAHITLLRFLENVTLEDQTMRGILGSLQGVARDGLECYTITREDIRCVYGQVYYGGGKDIY